MADRISTAGVNPPPRRKVAGQVSLGGSPASSGPSTPLSSQPRLKAHINPANIIGGSPSPAAVPSPRPVVRVPSNVSVRTDAPVRSTPRSEVGGPSVARASPALGQRPLVARAGAGARAPPPALRSGASLPGSALPSGASTPTSVHVRRPSSVLGNNSSASTPLSRSPQPDQGTFNASTGSKFRAALAGAGASDSEAQTIIRPVHVRSASFTPGPRSDSSNSQLSSNSRNASRQGSGQSSPPRPIVSRNTVAGTAGVPRRRSDESSPRLPPAGAGAGTPPSSHSPSSSTDIPRMAVRQAPEPRLSALAEVTTSSENLTQHLAPVTSTPISSSLLSPSTLTPTVLPPPPTIDEMHLNGNGLELEPSSNHSSPVRPSLQLASPPSALHTHLAHLGLGSLATASAPTSPRGGNSHLGLERKRMPLPWNPTHGTPLSFPAPPESPELRTVALPIMTPARTPEASEHRTLKSASFEWRRFSSGSDNSQGETSVIGLHSSMSPRARVSPEATMPWSGSLLNGNTRDPSSSTARWESTGDESGYDLSDDHHSDEDIDLEAEIDANQLELTPSAEMDLERDKWERKIADLEISNSSLMKINRMLETTKVKQQGEIMRLRRALRDARSGVPERPVLERVPSSTEEDPDSSGSWGDDEMEDPELEKRWDQLRDLVSAMRKTGEDAVERLRQDVKPHQRVLGWLEVEAMGIGRSEDTTRAQSEVDPAETVSGATETTDDYSNTDVTDTMSERSETAPTEIGLTARVRGFN
ncbi:hypothetical protein CspHIS471_0109300 [Cutaneotrichosporon sp. HIS471]|nr:hypothetical protein CspHIS471_0109300 [Cutaneotrichosporon sp. HIS471]